MSDRLLNAWLVGALWHAPVSADAEAGAKAWDTERSAMWQAVAQHGDS